MIKNLLILFFLFYCTSSFSYSDTQIECRDRTGTVLIDIYLDSISNFNRLEVRNLRNGFYSFSTPRETVFRCSENFKCYLSNDNFYDFFMRIDKKDVTENTARFIVIYFEIRNFRTGGISNEFLNCTKFYVK